MSKIKESEPDGPWKAFRCLIHTGSPVLLDANTAFPLSLNKGAERSQRRVSLRWTCLLLAASMPVPVIFPSAVLTAASLFPLIALWGSLLIVPSTIDGL